MPNARQPAPPTPEFSRAGAAVLASTISLSAFLLFSIEPVMAKRILPWFGGSAAVWSTCLVFYQTALLLGYLYARLLTRIVSPRVQFLLHVGLLVCSLAFAPVAPAEWWKPGMASDPTWLILGLLTANIGLPFVALSATTPLVQHWLARGGYQTPYRLFALSNLASLAALLAYPLWIEPSLGTTAQIAGWRSLYLAFALLCGITAWRSSRPRDMAVVNESEFEWTSPWRKAWWFSLSACGSVLLLSVTNHIDQNVAAVPLLWILPLAVYLLTFILGFGSERIFRRALWLRLLAFALGVLGYSLYNVNAVEPIQLSLPVFLMGLFVCCMFCHGELNRLRPSAAALTDFYLLIAAGGAAGAVFVGVIAPRIFTAVYELPVALALTSSLAALLIWSQGAWPVRLLWVAATVCMLAIVVANVKAYHADTLSMRRSFYGSLRVTQSPRAGPQQTRTLFHGIIEHGAQFLLPPGRFRATTYYGPDSGIGIVLREGLTGPKRVGVVGLGTGTLAAYGQAGDTFRFYEINSQIVDLASSLFFYLRESHARIQIVEGDARLSIERDTSPAFDVLALDAFSGDAIPVHLLTREAFSLYARHLQPQGILAFHVSNGFLDLAPIVNQLAAEAGFHAVLVRSHENDEDLLLPADWVLVTNNPGVLENTAVQLHSAPIASRAGLRPWTDDYNNLLGILKAPRLR